MLNIIPTGSVISVLSFFLIFGVGLILLGLLLGLLFYVFYSVGLMKIAQKEGFGQPQLAWVPFVNLFLIPILTENDVYKPIRGKFTTISAVTLVASIILGFFIPFIGLVPLALWFYGFYFLASRYSEQAVIHLVIAVITCGLSVAFSLFRFRNRKAIYK